MDEQADPVDRYLARLPSPERRALGALRRTIRDLVPSVEEVVRVGVPQFRVVDRPLVSIGASKRHPSLYVMYSEVLPKLADRLAGLDWSGTVVRFTPEAPLPDELIATIVQARLEELGVIHVD